MGKIRCRFIGLESQIGVTKLNRFGQRFEVAEELFDDARKGGVALLDEDDFNNLEFSPREISIWGSPFISEHDMPADEVEAKEKLAFFEKKRTAIDLFIAQRHTLLAPHDRPIEASASRAVAEPLIMEVEETTNGK